MEIPPENLNTGLNIYFAELKAANAGNSESSFHRTNAAAMKRLIYGFGILDDISNHDLVEEAIKAAEKAKVKKSKRQVK